MPNVEDRKYWLTELANPVTAQIGLTDPERQGVYNLARKQQTGAESTAMEALKASGAGRGFRAGESGFMDTAMGKLYGQGAERLGGYANEQAIQEVKDRFNQNMQLNQLNQNRLLGGGNMLMGFGQADTAEAAVRNQGKGLEWEKEKFGQTFPWEQETTRMNQLMQMMGMMGQSQQDVYAPYYQGINTAG